MGYVSKYRGIDIDQAIEFSKNNADIDEKLSKKAEVLHTHKLSDITGLSDLKVSWDNIIGKPSVFPCDGSCGGGGGNNDGDSSGSGSGTGGGTVTGPVSWGQITGKPNTFTPTAHTHVITDLSNIQDLRIDWSNIVNKPEDLGGGNSTVYWENIENKPAAFNPTTHYHSWESIEGKPAQYTPSAHKHTAADIEGLIQAGEVEWENIKGKPELADKIHTHTISEVIGLDEKLSTIIDSSGLSVKVDTLQANVDNLQTQVGGVQSTLGTVQGSLGVLQGTMTGVQNDVITNKADIATLKETVKEIQENGTGGGSGSEGGSVSDAELILIKQDVTKLKAADVLIEEDIDKLETKVSGITENISSIESEMTTMKEAVDKVTVDLVKEVDKAIQESEFGERLDEINTKLDGNDSLLEDISTTIQEFQEDLSEFDSELETFKDSFSESYYIWQGEDDSVPTLINEPASSWITDADKRAHLGDFFINKEGYCYKFILKDNEFIWEIVKDRYIVPYAKEIYSKSKIFISKPENIDTYKPGDLWLNATYSGDGVSYSGINLLCVEEKLEEDFFDINHWEPSSVVSSTELDKVSDKIDNYQTRVILNRKDDLFLESTWRDNSTGELWIYNGLVISVIQEQKLYLLIDKNNYQKESAWIEIGKTLSLTWDNITDKPDYLETIGSDITTITENLEQLTTNIVESNQIIEERFNEIENESIAGLETEIENIQDLLNDHYYIWQGEDNSIPTLINEPAVSWVTDTDKSNHVGDFYINSEGYCYRFVRNEDTSFSWIEVQDRYIVPYAKRIEKRSTIFISQPTSEDFYSPGDLWINATYSETEGTIPLYQRAVLVCTTRKEEGEDFDISHWESSEIASVKSIEEVENKIEDYRTRVILRNKSDLYQESTWKDGTGELWIYNGLVISVVNDQKLYLLVNKDRYQDEDSWIEIGKTLSLTWDNITDKPDYLDNIDGRVQDLEAGTKSLEEQVLGNFNDLSSRIDTVENESITEIEANIEDLQELLRDHYYIWQGEDNIVPSLMNDPAMSWIDSEKKEHIGDFYINSEGYCYRFVYENNEYSWKEVQDRYIVPYARRIENKSAIFIAQPEKEDSYRIGDLWLNASYDKEGTVIDRRTLVCVEDKNEGEEFLISHWEVANIVDHELEEVDAKIEDYRTRIILKRKTELFLEDTWTTSEGKLWIYEGLVVSVLDVEKLYLLIDVNNFNKEDSWVEIGKTLSLTWDNITDKPELSPSDHVHDNYETQLSTLEGYTETLQTEMLEVQETLLEYDTETFPKIQDNLDQINDSLIGQFYIWHGTTTEEPSSDIEPEVNWSTNEDKDAHVGDFYLTSEGVCYKYVKDEKGKYFWQTVSDKYIISYAKKIDGKSTIFYETPTDIDAYKPGDIWVSATYTNESGIRVFNDDIAICIVGKSVDDPFNYEDWQAVMKADDVNLDNTTVKVGVNQTVNSHKTFVEPVYFGPDGTGPTKNGTEEEVAASAYKKVYSSISSKDGVFLIETSKRDTTTDAIQTEIRNLTGGGIRIAADLLEKYKADSSKTGEILLESKYGGDIRILSDNDKEKVGGAVRISTKTSGTYDTDGTAIDPYKRLGFSLSPETNTASFYSQKAGVPVENLCDGYAEFSGFDGMAITSRAAAGRQDMTGVRFRWIKEDSEGNLKNTLDIHKISMNENKELESGIINIRINDNIDVLTSANWEEVTGQTNNSNSINFLTVYSTEEKPIMTDGSEDISEQLNKAISDCLGSDENNSMVSTRTLVIPFGTYRISKPIFVQGIHNSTTSFSIEANNSIFICDQGLEKIMVEGSYPAVNNDDYGNTGDINNNHIEAIVVNNYLFTVGENYTGTAVKDKGLFEFRNAVFRPSNGNVSNWGCFDIAGQDAVVFNNITINNFYTAIRAKNCTNNPMVTRSKFDGNYIGYRSLGNICNLTIEDCSFTNTGTAIYLDKNSLEESEFANNIISHCIFQECVRGIYGNSPWATKSLNIKCNKFSGNNEFDIFLKNHSVYSEIPVTFMDISDKEGNVIQWDTREVIEITYAPNELISEHLVGTKETVSVDSLSSVVPYESALGTSHEAIYLKKPNSWGDCNVSITDNIFYETEGIKIGNDANGKHVSGVIFSGNRVTSKTEGSVRICSDLPRNCSAISVFGNSYESTKRDLQTGNIVNIGIEAPITSSLLSGKNYMPAGGLMARYSAVPDVPVTSGDEEGQVGDLRWDETKAYLKTEKGWKAIQFTHSFDNDSQSVKSGYKFMEFGSQEPTVQDTDKVGDIVWNFGGNGRTLGWRFVEISTNEKKWVTLEQLIKENIS